MRGWAAGWRWAGCSAGRALERKVWMRWWRTDCCWSPADSAPEDDPVGGRKRAEAAVHLLLSFCAIHKDLM